MAFGVMDRVKKQIFYRLNNLTKVALEKSFKIKIDCPCNTLPEKTIPTRPNGFDIDRQRLTFCCMKQCLNLKVPGKRNLDKTYDIGSCEHLNKTCGYTTHLSIDQHPRLLNEIPRGTRRYNDIKRCRSASERSNSTVKETLNILEKPIVYNKVKADILVQIATIALLLYRAFTFIVKISMLFMKY